MMHVINSSRLRLGGPCGVEEGNALSLSICMRLPRGASSERPRTKPLGANPGRRKFAP